MFATFTIHKSMLVADPEKPGFYNALTSKGVVSVQPHDGSIQYRPVGTNGSFEEFYIKGNWAIFPDVDGLVFTVPYVE